MWILYFNYIICSFLCFFNLLKKNCISNVYKTKFWKPIFDIIMLQIIIITTIHNIAYIKISGLISNWKYKLRNYDVWVLNCIWNLKILLYKTERKLIKFEII